MIRRVKSTKSVCCWFLCVLIVQCHYYHFIAVSNNTQPALIFGMFSMFVIDWALIFWKQDQVWMQKRNLQWHFTLCGCVYCKKHLNQLYVTWCSVVAKAIFKVILKCFSADFFWPCLNSYSWKHLVNHFHEIFHQFEYYVMQTQKYHCWNQIILGYQFLFNVMFFHSQIKTFEWYELRTVCIVRVVFHAAHPLLFKILVALVVLHMLQRQFHVFICFFVVCPIANR